MKYNQLGTSDLNVSRICLGTMTFGEQNSEQEGHEQLNYALEQGINFIDTAELYAIPPCAETYGLTEKIIGSWLKLRGRRDDVVLASKIAGPGADWVSHIRGGRTRFNKAHIVDALDSSLQRLQTDYLDLYQLHWPERNTNYFGKLGYEADHNEQELTPLFETLEVLEEQIRAGKIRYVGLSNETPWGIMQFLWTARVLKLPSIVTVQNPYSLLNRSYEVGCAEISHREGIGLMAYSPLGFGVLTGKYLNDEPEGARLTRWPHYARYSNAQAVAATRDYVQLAGEYGLDPAQMALAFVNSRPFVTANIIGATNMTQLKRNIASIDIELSTELLEKIDAVHQRHPNPSP